MKSTANTTDRRHSVVLMIRKLGADLYDLALPETHSLATLLVPGEMIEGIVYGRYHRSNGLPGRGALVATDRRVIFIDSKPMSLNASEISYDVISGISRGTTGMVSTVTLNTRIGDVWVRTFNPRTADFFVRAIESHIFRGPSDFRPIRPQGTTGPE